ncbi:MAG: glycosyltransferase family 4 protein [Desulfosoma sp.]|uniref:glycosyltransferase family 4 protein n=1 Tax=Desulfosoma sp. TaxID=2603217 RepID=UPI00404B607D
MNILVVTDNIPAHDRSSYEFRLTMILRSLAKVGSTKLCLVQPLRGGDPAKIQKAQPYIESLSREGISVLFDAATSCIKQENPGVIIFTDYTVGNPRLVQQARYWAPKATIITDAPDVVFNRLASKARLTGSISDIAAVEKQRVQELAAFRMADIVTVVSLEEKNILRRYLAHKPIYIVPTIHPLNPYVATDRRDQCSLIFVGWGAYEPNVDAVSYFIEAVFPHIQENFPKVKLFVVGGDYPSSIQSLGNEGITFLGRVPHTEPFLKNCHVSIAPLRYGSGLKGKIGEAMSYGTPVVTTDVGAEGFNFTPGVHALVGNNPNDFCTHVLNLLRSRELHSRIGRAGWEFIRKNYSVEAIEPRIRMLFTEIMMSPQRVRLCAAKILRKRAHQALEKYILWRFRRY